MGVLLALEASDEEHRRAVRRVFDAHARDVWRALCFLGVPESDVPDVCQDVFVTVHRRLHTFEGRSSLSSWIYGICLRTVAAYRRKAHRRHEQPVAEVPREESADAPQERAVIASERLERLRRVLATLDDKQRQVFVLYEVEHRPMKEIAESLDVPLQTAYSRLRAARQHVRRGFELEVEGAAE